MFGKIPSVFRKGPDWYWKSGLHDAKIVSVEETELAYDYTQKNPLRNCLVMYIDADGAIYDQTVTEIRLYNYKILSDDSAMKAPQNKWWLSDQLIQKDGKYVLTVNVQMFAPLQTEFDFVVRFEQAEVTRK